MFQRSLILLCCLFLSFVSFGQQHVIQAVIVDKERQEPLHYIHVILRSSDHKLLTFKQTDENGAIIISTVKNVEGAYLEISHLGYQKKIIDVAELRTNQIIELEQKSVLLQDIEIKSKPQINRIGDTLAYDVSSFAKLEDRSIGEVLKRMPGIEVGENGAIKYQGKFITKFYIDGDDLLDDRYDIGTRTIPHLMVKDVEVLTNHEHMKVLKNKRYTDEVAINLVIKEQAKLKLTGQAKLGAGFPKNYDVELNSILFNKEYKILNVLQGNNIGNDLSGDFTGFNQSSVLAQLGYLPINNLLALGTVGNPPIAKSNYFLNNSIALNANYLMNIKNGLQLKSNLQLLNNKNRTSFAGRTSYSSEDGDFIFDEDQYTKTAEWLAALRLTLSKNHDKHYFNNTFALEYEKEDQQAIIMDNGNRLNGQLNHKIHGLSNQLEWIPELKNGNIIQVDWFLNYANKPQTLAFSPGLFPDFFSEDLPYEQTLQHVKVPTIFSKANIGYRLTSGWIKQFYQIGAMLEDQQLKTGIDQNKRGEVLGSIVDSTWNDLHWTRSNLTVNAAYEWNNNKLSTKLILPVVWQKTKYKDGSYAINEGQHNLLFNPSFLAKLRVKQEDELSFSYVRSNSFGTIENVYKGFLIRNYRTLSVNNSGINSNKIDNVGFNYKMGRTIRMLFLNFGLNYKQSFSSTMLSHVVNEASIQTKLIDHENVVKSYQASIGFDKFIFALGSTMKLSASWSLTDYNQFFNKEILPFQNVAYELKPSMELKVWEKINLSYSGQLSWINTRQMTGATNLNGNSFNISQQISLPINLLPNLHLKLSASNWFAKQPEMNTVNYVFFDTFIRYRHKKLNTDFELNLTNLTDVRSFESYHISANMQVHNRYELRGRMAVLKAIFNFK